MGVHISITPSLNHAVQFCGSSGSNEVGGQFQFLGTYTVRPSTLRAIYMDLTAELGD